MDRQSDTTISVQNLHKTFGDLHVLKGIDLDVHRGEVVVLIGSSGSGKTTLLRCLNFLAEYEQGQIHIDEKLMWYRDAECRTKRSTKEIAHDRAAIGMVFQSFNLFPHRTVLENIILGPTKVKPVRVPVREATEQAMSLLDRVGLLEKADAYPNTCRADNSSAWRLRGPSPWNPRSCCLTKSPPPLTPNWSARF